MSDEPELIPLAEVVAWAPRGATPWVRVPSSEVDVSGQCECEGCPAAGRHATYQGMHRTEEVPTEERLDLGTLRAAQYALNVVREQTVGLVPTGYATEADRSINFTYEVARCYVFEARAADADVDGLGPTEGSVLVVAPTDFGDLGARAIYQRAIANTGGVGRSILTYVGAAPQAGDRMEILPPSRSAGIVCRVWRVRHRRLEGTDPNGFAPLPDGEVWPPPTREPLDVVGAEVVVDRSVHEWIMQDGSLAPVPGQLYEVRFLRESADRPRYQKLRGPVMLRGVHRRLRVYPPAEMDAPVELELPRSDGTPGRTANVKGTAIRTNGTMADVTAAVGAVWRMVSTGPGADGTGAYRSWLSDVRGLFGEDVRLVLIEYAAEATAEEAAQPDGCLVAPKICVHCERDYTGSSYDATQGEARTASGEVWRCGRMQWQEEEEWYNPESNRMEWRLVTRRPETLIDLGEEAAGANAVRWFTAHCSLQGVCSQYARVGWGPGQLFSWRRNVGRWLREVNAQADLIERQGIPGVSLPAAWRIARVGAPSLRNLHASPKLEVPTGRWERNVFPQQPGLLCGPPQVVDGEDGEELRVLRGTAYAQAGDAPDWSAATIEADGSVTGVPADGVLAAWSGEEPEGTELDPLGAAWSNETDAGEGHRRGAFAQGLEVERHTGTTRGIGLSGRTKPVGPGERIILPRLLRGVRGVQVRADGEAEFYGAPQTGPAGFEYGARIRLRMLRAEGRGVREVASGTVAGVQAGTYRGWPCVVVDCANTARQWISQVVEGPGSVVVTTKTYAAGGGVVEAVEGARPNNYADLTGVGGMGNGARVGDGVGFGGTVEGHGEWGAYRWCVLGARAFAGPAAEDWGPGGEQPPDWLVGIPGYSSWGKQMDRIWVYDPHGWLAEHVEPGMSFVVERGAVCLAPVAPEDLAVGTAVPGRARAVEELDFDEVDGAGVLVEHGRGVVYVGWDAVQAWPGAVCVGVWER